MFGFSKDLHILCSFLVCILRHKLQKQFCVASFERDISLSKSLQTITWHFQLTCENGFNCYIQNDTASNHKRFNGETHTIWPSYQTCTWIVPFEYYLYLIHCSSSKLYRLKIFNHNIHTSRSMLKNTLFYSILLVEYLQGGICCLYQPILFGFL